LKALLWEVFSNLMNGGGRVQKEARSLLPLIAALAISPEEITEFALGTPQACPEFASSLLLEVLRCRHCTNLER
jgi:hypothetical protein